MKLLFWAGLSTLALSCGVETVCCTNLSTRKVTFFRAKFYATFFRPRKLGNVVLMGKTLFGGGGEFFDDRDIDPRSLDVDLNVIIGELDS